MGSAAFSQIHRSSGSDEVRIIAGVLAILAAILAGLQTFFRFGETAERYRVVGIGYEKVEKETEEILALQIKENIQEEIDALRDEMNKLANDSPDIPSHDHLKQRSDVD